MNYPKSADRPPATNHLFSSRYVRIRKETDKKWEMTEVAFEAAAWINLNIMKDRIMVVAKAENDSIAKNLIKQRYI